MQNFWNILSSLSRLVNELSLRAMFAAKKYLHFKKLTAAVSSFIYNYCVKDELLTEVSDGISLMRLLMLISTRGESHSPKSRFSG